MTNKEINLTLRIPPKPLKRARHGVRGGFVSTYYKKEDKLEMQTLENAIINSLSSEDKLDIKYMLENEEKGLRISVDMDFMFSFPASYSKKKRERLLHQGHTNKPDFDNLVKNVLDRSNGILWSDDKLIWKSTSKKFWNEYDGINIKVIYELMEE